MMSIIRLVLAATLVAGASIHSHLHNHNHKRFHAELRDNDPAQNEKRDPAAISKVIPTTVFIYHLEDGEVLDETDARKGIDNGLYVVMGTSTPTLPAGAPDVTPTPTNGGPLSTPTGSIPADSKPLDMKPATDVKPSLTLGLDTLAQATPTSPLPDKTGASQEAKAVGLGLDDEFPSGEIDCSHGVPTQYGPITVKHIGLDGWTGLQHVDSWDVGSRLAFNYISSPSEGGCKAGMFCSYACPAGYQKSQFPEAQGAKGESVGGLYCNMKGKLELSNPQNRKLCVPGAGGVYVENALDTIASICRTDYPGTENMDIPLVSWPGKTYPLTNPDAQHYYMWKGAPTSAQYYVNPKGFDKDQSCLWKNPDHPDSTGNWAPLILGVGKDVHGVTYLSIFPNSPTSVAKLDFNIEILGDVNSKCFYKDGTYSGGASGCTTAITKDGGTATFRFF